MKIKKYGVFPKTNFVFDENRNADGKVEQDVHASVTQNSHTEKTKAFFDYVKRHDEAVARIRKNR